MKRLFYFSTIFLAISVSFSYAQMMGQEMMPQTEYEEASTSQATYPCMFGSGMMGYGMMGPGGHMMGPGQHMMRQGMMGCGMIGPGCGGYMMEGMMGFQSQEEYQKHLDDTKDLRRQLYDKQFQLSEAMRRPDIDRKTILQLKKEMLEIKVNMYDMAIKAIR